jgi:hypothetical protein
VHQADDRVERDQARAGHEPQVREVEEQVAGPRLVQPADLLDERSEVGRVEFAVEGQHRDRHPSGCLFD